MACLDNIEVIDLVSGKQSGLLVVKRSLMLGKVPSIFRGCSADRNKVACKFGLAKHLQ
jgi:hypothetical protein